MNVTTILRIPRTMRNAGRVREILTVLVKYGFGELVEQLGLASWAHAARRLMPGDHEAHERMPLETRIRRSLEELGPTFVKLGQVMATRPDLVPMSLVLELRRLQDDVKPFGGDEAQAMIEAELGRPVSEIFASFEAKPLAAASIGQVHRATLTSGEAVVVKVQRPGLERAIARDMAILTGLVNLIDQKIPESRQFDLPGVVTEFGAALRLEADFTNERYNIERFSSLWTDDPDVAAPTTYPALSSRRVLTMELIEGAKVTDAAAMEAIGVDPLVVARRGTHIALRGIFEHGFFHADPHPGNFFVLPGGRITLIDFGMMGVVDEERIGELLTFLVAIVLRDAEMLARLFLEMDIIADTTDVRSLKREVKALLDRYYAVPIGEIDLGAFINRVFEVVVKHDVKLPADLLLVGKSLTTIEGIAQEIYPDYDPITEMRPYLLRTYALRVLDPGQHAKHLARDMSELALLLRRMPSDIRALLKKARKGELRTVTAIEDLPEILGRQERRTNRGVMTALTIGAGSMGTWLLLTGHPTAGAVFWTFAGLWTLWLWLAILRSGGI